MFNSYKPGDVKLENGEKVLAYQIENGPDGKNRYRYGKYKDGELENIINGLPKNDRYLYEHIWGENQVRGYWDIELYPADCTMTEAKQALDIIERSVMRNLNLIYGVKGKLIICSSCKEDEKYSWHIIAINAIFKNMRELRGFSEKIKLELGNKLAVKALDMTVYGESQQLLRLLGCVKRGSDRVKVFAERHVNVKKKN